MSRRLALVLLGDLVQRATVVADDDRQQLEGHDLRVGAKGAVWLSDVCLMSEGPSSTAV